MWLEKMRSEQPFPTSKWKRILVRESGESNSSSEQCSAGAGSIVTRKETIRKQTAIEQTMDARKRICIIRRSVFAKKKLLKSKLKNTKTTMTTIADKQSLGTVDNSGNESNALNPRSTSILSGPPYTPNTPARW